MFTGIFCEIDICERTRVYFVMYVFCTVNLSHFVCARVCVCVCARACMRVCLYVRVLVRVCVCVTEERDRAGVSVTLTLKLFTILFQRTHLKFSNPISSFPLYFPCQDLFPALLCNTVRRANDFTRRAIALHSVDTPLLSDKVCQFYSRLRCSCTRFLT